MKKDNAINDHLSQGDEGYLKMALDNIQDNILSIMDWADLKIERTNESVALINLLSSTSQFIHTFQIGIGNHISILALATRSLYEINLISRSIINDKEDLDTWCRRKHFRQN